VATRARIILAGADGVPNARIAAQVGVSLFRDFVLPFEVVSVLLLAALVGAVVIARKEDPA